MTFTSQAYTTMETKLENQEIHRERRKNLQDSDFSGIGKNFQENHSKQNNGTRFTEQ